MKPMTLAKREFSAESLTYERTIKRIAAECSILDANTLHHTVLGKVHPPRDLEVDQNFPVLRHLWRIIYLYYYAGDLVATHLFINGGRAVAAVPDHETFELVEEYERVQQSPGYLASGWKILRNTGEEVVVSKAGLTVRVPLNHVSSISGATCTVRIPASRRYAVMGWYSLVGSSGPVNRDEQNVRVYLTINEAEVASQVLTAVTNGLEKLNVPYQYKLVNNRESFVRKDNSVLYLPKDTASGETWKNIDKLFRYLSEESLLRDDTPFLAKRLYPGVAIASEPVNDGSISSFGEHRCRLIAEGLVSAYKSGKVSLEGKLEEVRAAFHFSGISLERPYE